MSITEKINEIIDRRIGRNNFEGKGHLDIIKRKKDFFESLGHLVDDYSTLRRTILLQIEERKGEFYLMSVEDPTFHNKIVLADPETFQIQLQKCLKECVRLEKRFGRETINISVVGRARQGKSRLLQSISRLPNSVIPADDGGDCTGAKSVISNRVGPATDAMVSFYSEKEIIDVVNDYLKALDSQISIGSVNQIPYINIEQIEESITSGTDRTSLLGHLEKYVRNYSAYSHLLGTSLPVSDPAEIRRYTSQYLDCGEKTYEYLGVKEVNIFTEFKYSDVGKLQLVDTIGLFDTALGLEQKMMNTLADESDAAILLRLPNPNGDHVDEHDNKLYNDIEKQLGADMLNKWLFYVLNVWSDNEKSGKFMYDQLMKQFGKTLRSAFVKQVNCANEEDVETEIVLPILETLSNNLIDIDNNLMQKANAIFERCYVAFADLYNNVLAILNSNFKQAVKQGGLFDQLYSKELKLAQRLESLNMEYSDRKRECNDIKDEIFKVLKTLRTICPNKDAILECLSRGDVTAHPQIVYHNMADYFRAAISDQFEEINHSTITRLQEGVKAQIIDVLKSEEGGKLCMIPTETESESPTPDEWLEAFIAQHLGFFPLLKAAFENVLVYRLNIEGLLEYRVNNSLEHLEPESSSFEQHTFNADREQNAEEIHQALLRTIPIVGEKLMDNIAELLYIPYNSFYARIKKLRERVIYSEEGSIELKEFYREKASYIWHDRFAAIVSKETALASLNTMCDKLALMRSKGLFTIKL